MALDVLEVLEGAGDLPAVDGLGGLAGVLERNTEVGAARAGGLGRLDVGGGVTDLLVKVLLECCWESAWMPSRAHKVAIEPHDFCTRNFECDIPS